MKRSTRELIKERNKYALVRNGYRMDAQHITAVKQLKTHDAGQCFKTAMAGREIDALGSGSTRNVVVSGWLVGDYNTTFDGYEVLAHYWNIDEKTNMHFDLSKGAHSGEYVMDMGLSLWAQDKENYARITSVVQKSLLYKDGEWRTYEVIDGNEVIEDITDLRVENLFK
jgi:hypothetical protein